MARTLNTACTRSDVRTSASAPRLIASVGAVGCTPCAVQTKKSAIRWGWGGAPVPHCVGKYYPTGWEGR
ncbi:hypothetical protein GCM10010185_61600 [Saccharothrix coeruleofusca]|uniref:Uncharacterized protein n=1 Tax=Saccharothrix coeruleofusca TaxID=33919 RepID=A0A918EHP7_9PSEU|nr:hypothetical protein GCM10010185_61600 [Saccharothrix coeruleofusca]